MGKKKDNPAPPEEEKAELFKQRPLEEEQNKELEEFFGSLPPAQETETIPPDPETIEPEEETKGLDPEPEQEETGNEQGRLPRIESHIETQTLKCILTETEIKQAGDLMARADGERVDSEAVLKSLSAQYKAKIAAAEAVVGAEAAKIRTGYEFRPVEVKVEFDHDRGTVEKFRTDTFECIESRRMTEYEAQRKIRFS